MSTRVRLTLRTYDRRADGHERGMERVRDLCRQYAAIASEGWHGPTWTAALDIDEPDPWEARGLAEDVLREVEAVGMGPARIERLPARISETYEGETAVRWRGASGRLTLTHRLGPSGPGSIAGVSLTACGLLTPTREHRSESRVGPTRPQIAATCLRCWPTR